MSVSPSPTDRAALITRLHRIEGQVRALSRMIDQDAPCIDILTQVSAASHALQSVALILLDDHLPGGVLRGVVVTSRDQSIIAPILRNCSRI